jgi:hypothetical protein
METPGERKLMLSDCLFKLDSAKECPRVKLGQKRKERNITDPERSAR